MDFSEILAHPDHETIASKLATGDSTKAVNQWLRIKYPDKEQKHLIIPVTVLQEYADKYINCMMDQVRNDLLATKRGEKIEKKLAASLLNNKTYQERLNEAVDQEIDIKKEIRNIGIIIRARAEQIFDVIQNNPNNIKVDYTLIKWCEMLLSWAEKFDKIHNNAPDQIIQHNISVQHVEQNIAVFQEAIRETLAQLNPEVSLLFMEIFSKKMNDIKPAQTIMPTIESRAKEAKILKEFNTDDEDEDDE